MNILVQKYGGTSLATVGQREKVVAKIKEAIGLGYKVVVVVSAIGRRGAPYATDTLISLSQEVFPQIHSRELDIMMSCGELISSVILVQSLKAEGIEAQAFTGGQAGIITNSNFGDARIIEVKPEKLMNCLQENKVGVVAGFQGITKDGEITTLGRGGSDTTAVALGVALQAEMVEIYTDVDGVMTADPHVVPHAKPLKVMTYSEVCEMAHLGAKVIHPRAVEIAMEGRVPLRIRSIFSDQEGTLISNGISSLGIEIKTDKIVTGLAYITDVAQFNLFCHQDLNTSGKALEVFSLLAESGISLDMIQVSPQQITFTIQETYYEAAVTVLEKTALEFKAAKGFAKVAVVGAGMRGVPGVMAKVVEGLYLAKVPLYQTADSHTNIACLVKKEDMSRALKALHDEFGLGE